MREQFGERESKCVGAQLRAKQRWEPGCVSVCVCECACLQNVANNTTAAAAAADVRVRLGLLVCVG